MGELDYKVGPHLCQDFVFICANHSKAQPRSFAAACSVCNHDRHASSANKSQETSRLHTRAPEWAFKTHPSTRPQEHIDYDLVESTNPAFGKAIIRVNVFRNHRQTVQYIQPQHHAKLAQAELLVIDEVSR
jgi:hypothetical protein